MAKHAFIERKFTKSSYEMIETINKIIGIYQAKGFVLSLRQLYYQLVARDLIPNTVAQYKTTGSLVSDARLAGLIDWDMIEDRGRSTMALNHWRSPADIVKAAAQQFRIDKWATQNHHIELMVEKDALSGVLVPTCNQLDIAITANKGYSSSSMMYETGRRLRELYLNKLKQITVIYLGDHDPSGIDMTRDVNERLHQFAELEPGTMEIIRIALNYNQVEEWQPPENPAKSTDSRYESYAAEFGTSSWELDAVEPERLQELIEEIVFERREADKWEAAVEREDKMRADLLTFAKTYKE